MRIGITGSQGFIGSHVKEELIRKGHEVREFDMKTESLLDIESMKDFVSGKDLIYHLAGVNRPDDVLDFYSVNTVGTAGLVEAMQRFGKSGAKIIFASSFQVYSSGNKKHKEGEGTKPYSKYGWSKKFAEEIIMDSGINHIIFRISNVYGPGARPFYNSVVATFIELISNESEISLYNFGAERRDFIYIQDVVFAMMLAIEIEQGIYNLCTEEMVSIKELVSILSEIIGKKAKTKDIKKDTVQVNVEGDCSRLRHFGWEPKIRIKDGLKRCIQQ
jgi:nucleoside-diphosphate-sugar epimerase